MDDPEVGKCFGFITNLDDGTILTGTPVILDGKNPWFPVIFPTNPLDFRRFRIFFANRQWGGIVTATSLPSD